MPEVFSVAKVKYYWELDLLWLYDITEGLHTLKTAFESSKASQMSSTKESPGPYFTNMV